MSAKVNLYRGFVIEVGMNAEYVSLLLREDDEHPFELGVLLSDAEASDQADRFERAAAAIRSLIDTHERPGVEPSGVPAEQGADALAGGSSDGGSPETERAMASATPGRSELDEPDELDDLRPCPSCGASFRAAETHWSLFPEPMGGYICPTVHPA